MFRLNLISIFLIVLISVLNAAEFPSDVKRCKSADSECQKNNLQEMVEKFHDPFEVQSLTLPKINTSFVNIELKFNGITLTGLSNVKVEKVSGLKEDGPHKFTYEVEGKFPQIELNGPYSVDGKINKLSVTGQGKSKIIFDNIDAKIKGKLSIVEVKGKKYLNVDQVHTDLNPKKTTFAFDNLFNGDAALGDMMNKLLNENSAQVYNELKPVIMGAFDKILINIVNGVLSNIEYSEVFLPA